jgi:hypothetical protein
MLSSFRKAGDNIFVKIIILFIIVAFGGISLSNLFNNNTGDIVTFKHCSAITASQLAAQVTERKKFFAENKMLDQISDEQILNSVLQENINTKLLQSLAQMLQIEVLPQDITNFIAKLDYLQDDNKQFSQRKLDDFLKHLGMSQTQYYEQISKILAGAVIDNAFSLSNYQNEFLMKALKDFFAQERLATIVSVDKNKLAQDVLTQISTEDARQFFNDNSQQFQLPETRKIQYLVLDFAFFHQKGLIQDASRSKEFTSLLSQYEELLGDYVSSGMGIAEIATNIGAKVHDLTQASEQLVEQNLDLALHVKAIFELQEGQISYPLVGGQKIVLCQTNGFNASYVPDFNQIVNKVRLTLAKQRAELKARELFDDLIASAQDKDIAKLAAAEAPFKVTRNVLFAKNLKDSQYPSQLIENIFQTDKTKTTGVVMDENFAYIANVTEIRVSKEVQKSLDQQQIATKIINCYSQELIAQLYKINNVKINYDAPIFKRSAN